MRSNRRFLALFVALAIAVTATACGDDDDSDADVATTTTTIDRPNRIVSLSPTATETLFAIGAGKQVVAVDDQSNYPDDAPRTKLSGFQPNLEAISGYEPDLVVIQDDTGDLKAGLEKLGADVLAQPAAKTLDEAYAQWEQLGDVTGHADEAGELVARTERDLAKVVDDAPDDLRGKSYYHELDQTFFASASNTFIGDVYGLLGLENIADKADDGSGFPQLSAEYILQADPDIILLADTKCCGQSLQTVAKRPGWDRITAVRTGAVVELDDDIASRWGPRVVEFLDTVIDRVTDAGASS